jgi:hypothetical protein
VDVVEPHMTKCAPTLYSDAGPRWCWDQPKVRAVLEAARPPIVTIHATPTGLLSQGPKLTEDIRAALPGTEVMWSVAGDVGAPRPAWRTPAEAAQALGVKTFMVNCEAAWMGVSDAAARAAVEQIADAAPLLTIAHTAYDGPVNIPNPIPPPERWGRGGAYPWKGFLWFGSPVVWSAPQVYWDLGPSSPDVWGRGPTRLARCRASWAVAIEEQLIREQVRAGVYLQLHGCRCDNLCAVAATSEFALWWCMQPGYLQDGGVNALRAMCELNRLGYSGGNQIMYFQQQAGLTVDNRVGPRTLEELGIKPL